MSKCEMCGNAESVSEVTIGNKATGNSKTLQLCPDCAVKSAVAVKAGGGDVRFVEGSSKTKNAGCLSVIVLFLGVIGVLAWQVL